ncbi:MAG: histidinol-phosphate transaminase [Micrococcales bacterium]|nr:histidinol-phosphate transaminase [Micrococcales bacterium]
MSTESMDPEQEPQRRADRPLRFRATLDVIPAYQPGKPPAPVEGVTSYKMSSNENPYPPLPSVAAAVADELTSMNRYPDPSMHELRERLARELGVQPDELIIGNGSSGVLSQIVNACVDAGDEVIYAWRSFELYPICVAAAGGRSVQVPLTADGRHDLPAMAAAVHAATRIVIVCTPNNPTGPAVGSGELADFLAGVPADVLVLIDEAYLEFVTASDAIDSLALYRAHPNLVLLRTFSKAYGLAGLRVGYAIAHPHVAAALAKLGLPFVVTNLAQRAAVASLDVRGELELRVKSLVAQREQMVVALAEQGWDIPDTQANFVWLPLGQDAVEFAAAATARGLSVRPFPGDGVRVSIDEPVANETFLEVAAAFRLGMPRA